MYRDASLAKYPWTRDGLYANPHTLPWIRLELAGMEQQEHELAGQLPDCANLSLRDLDDLDGTVFAHAMRSLMRPDSRDTEIIAGFTNSIGDK